MTPLVSLPESPTVMLAAGSFSSPYEHLSQAETKRMVEHYTAYLSDNTRLIANPGLKVPPRINTATLTSTWVKMVKRERRKKVSISAQTL